MLLRLEDWLKDATAALSPVAEQPRAEARRLIEYVCDWDTVHQISEPGALLTREQFEILNSLLAAGLLKNPCPESSDGESFGGLI